jgi:predicted nucleotidyltransferase
LLKAGNARQVKRPIGPQINHGRGKFMNHSEHRKLQSEVLDKTLTILQNDKRVLGIVMAGSYARKQHDAFSDLDMGCYLQDENRTGREDLYDRVAKISPLLCRLWIYDLNALYLFENGVRLDLDFYRPSDIPNASEVYTDKEVIYDPDGVLSKLLPKSGSVREAKHPAWFEPGDPAMIDWFFWMFRQIVCWAKRGAQGDHRSYNKLTNAMNSLAEVRTRLIEMRLWTSGVQDYLSRVDPELARRISKTYPHFNAGEIIESAKLLLDEYAYICPMYCEKTGAKYPAHKVEIMHKLIREFEQLE